MARIELNAEVFREAAQILFKGRTSFCCSAIEHALEPRTTSMNEQWDLTDKYVRFLGLRFKPRNRRYHESWWPRGWEISQGSSYRPCHVIESRILALLLCAEMLENP